MNAIAAFMGDAQDDVLHRFQARCFSAGHEVRRDVVGQGRRPSGMLFSDAHGSRASIDGITVVADARIDGRAELAARLQISSQGTVPSAAEVIALAWLKLGERAIRVLMGDFAFVLWDAATESLVLARDYMGTRPLHYALRADGLVAASLPSTLASFDGPAAVDTETLARYHALLPQTGPESFFENVQRVEPATFVRWHRGRTERVRYWQPSRETIDIGADEAAATVRQLIQTAVDDRIAASPGPVAAQLSGGMDSSAVAAALGDLGVEAFAITGQAAQNDDLPPQGYYHDEARVAAATCALYPSLHHITATAVPTPLGNRMKDWNAWLDQPVRSIENMGWLEATYQAAAQTGASVLLVGDFGNNSFSYAGRGRFADLLRTGQLRSLIREGRSFRKMQERRWRGIASFALGSALPPLLWRTARGLPPKRELIAQRGLFRRGHPVVARLDDRARSDGHDIYERPASSSWGERAGELKWVDNALLNYAVRERYGVQPTDPLADRRLVEFTLKLPGHHWMDGGKTRLLAQRVLAGRVAPDVTDGQLRGLQGSGWREETEMSLAELRAVASRLRGTEFGEMLDLPLIDDMLKDWPSTGWSDYRQLMLYRAILLQALNLGHFALVSAGD